MRKNLYRLYLNGNPYGVGSWEYMMELMNDWVHACNMYGTNEVDFKIVKRTEVCESKYEEELDDWR